MAMILDASSRSSSMEAVSFVGSGRGNSSCCSKCGDLEAEDADGIARGRRWSGAGGSWPVIFQYLENTDRRFVEVVVVVLVVVVLPSDETDETESSESSYVDVVAAVLASRCKCKGLVSRISTAVS
jgi:hypothetical protein